ncbi:hypothetical protein D9M68_911890 [compost metagenome]
MFPPEAFGSADRRFSAFLIALSTSIPPMVPVFSPSLLPEHDHRRTTVKIIR